MNTVDIEDNRLIIKIGGDDFYNKLTIVKSLVDWEYKPESRIWEAPALPSNIEFLKINGFNFLKELNLMEKDDSWKDIKIDENKIDKLFPYQKEGVKFLEYNNGIGIIGDEMGLGKSAQSISYFKINSILRPVLVVCPASVKLNWQREIKLWGEENSYIIYGETPSYLPKVPWYIINYDILDSWKNILIEKEFQGVIIDEVQMISNPSAKRTKAIQFIKKNLSSVRFIALSGTPIRNRPSEFFSILNLIDSKEFSNRWKYLHRYCNPKHNGFGWTFNGASNLEELNGRIQKYMLRRLKEEVLKELPPKRKIFVPMELDPIELSQYKDSSKEFMSWVKEHIKSGIKVQDQIEKLKQQAYITKRNSVVQWIKDFLETEDKLIVFAYHRKVIDDLYEKFSKIAVKVDGTITGDKRQEAIDSFQNKDKIKLFIGQITAAGIGINLTASSSVAFIEFPWTSADIEQAIDRVHRIGQKADIVSAYFLVAEGTVEEDIMDLLQGKYKVVKQILDGEEDKDLFDGERNNLLAGLIDIYRKKNNE